MTDQEQAKAYAGELRELFEPVLNTLNAAQAKGFNISFQVGQGPDGKTALLGVQVDRVQRLVS